MYGRIRNPCERVAYLSRDDHADYRALKVGPPRVSSGGEDKGVVRYV